MGMQRDLGPTMTQTSTNQPETSASIMYGNAKTKNEKKLTPVPGPYSLQTQTPVDIHVRRKLQRDARVKWGKYAETPQFFFKKLDATPVVLLKSVKRLAVLFSYLMEHNVCLSFRLFVFILFYISLCSWEEYTVTIICNVGLSL